MLSKCVVKLVNREGTWQTCLEINMGKLAENLFHKLRPKPMILIFEGFNENLKQVTSGSFRFKAETQRRFWGTSADVTPSWILPHFI
jgi:hypothetical protein